MSDENENRPGRPPLTLKPRTGSVSAGVVKQSFSHGRTKTVVVETKRARTPMAPSGNLAGPSAAERRASDPRPAAPRPAQSGGAGGLSAEEMQARQRAIELAQQQAAAARAQEEARRKQAEDAARAA
ncbi:MAG: translation initiation factor IF-2 associated domain-containing protein, partial [Caulobacter sp.]